MTERMYFFAQEKQKTHLATLRLLKLCMSNVNECKDLAVRSCHVEVGFCLINILNPNENRKRCKNTKTLFLQKKQSGLLNLGCTLNSKKLFFIGI